MKHAALCHVMAVLFMIILKILSHLLFGIYQKFFWIHDCITKWCMEAWYSGVEISHRIVNNWSTLACMDFRVTRP